LDEFAVRICLAFVHFPVVRLIMFTSSQLIYCFSKPPSRKNNRKVSYPRT